MRRYARDHTWVVTEGKRARVGISDFAQAELGDIAYVELPAVSRRMKRGEVACTVDSLKSSSEIYAPVSGTVIEVNAPLSDEKRCGIVNRDPLGEGWLFVIEMDDPQELSLLLPEEEYAAFIRGADSR
ncbi:MAG: glycine cleavage system protein GcvH [Spirochaetia bacterium]|jgi:glycine cleavage system H protein